MPPRPSLLVPPSATRRLLIPRTSVVRSLSSLTITASSNAGFNKPTPSQSRRRTPPPPTPLTTTTTRPYSSWLLSAVSSAASALNNASPGSSNNKNNSAPETVLRARRILPYPPGHLYNLIADVSSYSQFLPHCSRSVVTAWATAPAPSELEPIIPAAGPEGEQPGQGGAGGAQGQERVEEGEVGKTKTKWPARGDLTVGWGPFTESYSSRVYCVPDDCQGVGIVEAVSGNASTNIPSAVLRQFGYKPPSGDTEKMEGLFESLVTRWTVRNVPAPGGTGLKSQGGEGGDKWTEVALSVRFKFANPALGFAVGQLAGQKVDEMVAAFEERARRTWRR